MSILPTIEGAARGRWLLLGSLALNLFFVGASGALAYRYTGDVPLAAVARLDHSLASRLDSMILGFNNLAGTLRNERLDTSPPAAG